ncbi:MAG: hypothetical protein R3E32_28200 [Chitinophagales bacterium]
MENSLLIMVLRTFSAKEMKQFTEFVDSPYFNKNKHLKALTTQLAKLHPNFSPSKANKEKLFTKLFPKTAFRNSTMLNLLSDLYLLAQKFLVCNKPKEGDITEQLWLMDEFYERGLDKHFKKTWEETQTKVAKSHLKDHDYYRNMAFLKQGYSIFQHDKKTNEYIQIAANRQERNEFVVRAAICWLFDVYGEVFNMERHVAIDFPFTFPLLEAMLEETQKEAYQSDSYLQISRAALLIEKNNELADFERLEALYEQHWRELDERMGHNVLVCLRNFCFAHRNVMPELNKKRFELNLKSLERYSLKGHYSYINDAVFINFVKAAMDVKEFEWAENFVNKYSELLHPDRKNGVTDYCRASILFYQQRFEEAVTILAAIEPYNDHTWYFNIKEMLLCCYYELKWDEMFIALLDSYKHTVKNRTDIAEGVRKQLQNYAWLIGRIFKIRTQLPKSAHKLSDLNEQISTRQPNGWSEWFSRKASALTMA